SRIMMHQGSAGIGGTTADILIQAENLDHSKQTMERLLAENTGQTPETIAHDGDRDRWFTAEEAKEYGMVDRVVESLADVRPASTAAGLLAGGDPGRRLVLEHARVLLGQPASGGSRGAISDLALQAKEMVRIRSQVEEVLARHTHHDIATLRADMDRDKVFTA